jgi:hypothetical protein
MKKKITVLTLYALLYALCSSAEAQQSTKVSRIGFLDAGNAAGSAVLVEAFRQELSKLGWIEGRISLSSTDLPSKKMINYLSLRRIWFVLRSI